MDKKNSTKGVMKISGALLSIVLGGFVFLAKSKQKNSIYEDEPAQKNPLEGKIVAFIEDENDLENADGRRGHLVAVGESNYHPGIYERYIKRVMDIVLSICGLIVLSPVFLIIAIMITIDDPGTILFTQKRLGKNKKYFKLHKFRTMKMETPHDVPTHMLNNPDQYITRVGKFLRAHSLDELPQIWDIFIGNLSVVGPRPGLWNQDCLVAERDKYGANDVRPGLTGWAQINGRDELEIEEKARYDGEYVKKLGLLMDLKCILGTIDSVITSSGVVEGGTGELHKKEMNMEKAQNKETPKVKKNILITGKDSYIGTAVKEWLSQSGSQYHIDELDMRGTDWEKKDFSNYDVVYHVAGIAHADTGHASVEERKRYYEVNTDLAVRVAEKAKQQGVKQFIFMSSMIIYSGCKEKVITEHTVPTPLNFYGDSKWKADQKIRTLATENFRVVVVRPPMIYGKSSKGNYPKLAKLAVTIPIFPRINNKRSMLHINNLCEFIKLMIDNNENGIFFPQNAEYVNTSELVQTIAKVHHKPMLIVPFPTLGINMLKRCPGKIGNLSEKVFGDSAYEMSMSEYKECYRVCNFQESIKETECELNQKRGKNKSILIISQYFYPEEFRINDICKEWVKRGYEVTVVTGIPNYPQGEFFDGYGYKQKRTEIWNGINIIRLPIRPRKKGKLNLALNYLSFVKSGYFWVRKTKLRANTVFIYEVSPMTQALVGVWYAQKYKAKCLLYVTDLWPENVEIVLGVHNRLFIYALGKMVDYIYKRCNYIFTSSQSFINKIEERGVKKDKLYFWPQYAEEFYKRTVRKDLAEIPNDEIPNLTFAGNIGTAQGLDVLVRTAQILKDEKIKVRFNIIGNGRYEEQFKENVCKANVIEYFNFISRQPAEKIPEYFACSDAALITLSKSEVYAMTIPAKTQSCLACGMPIIISADGEVQEIIKQAKCGYYSNSGDSVNLAKNIKQFINLTKTDKEKLSEHALKYYKQYFAKEKLMEEMEDYL